MNAPAIGTFGIDEQPTRAVQHSKHIVHGNRREGTGSFRQKLSVKKIGPPSPRQVLGQLEKLTEQVVALGRFHDPLSSHFVFVGTLTVYAAPRNREPDGEKPVPTSSHP
jgi:hypothetical protein